MKTLTKKLKLGVVLTVLVLLSSCGNNASVVSAIGINAFYNTIPSVAVKATKFTENKISEYLKGTFAAKNGKVITGKKVEKSGSSIKAKPVSIGIFRKVRLA